MFRILPVVFCFLLTFSGFAQEERTTFSEAISTHLPKYKEKADKAYRTNNVERAEFLFDSLVNHCLKGSHLDNFRVKNLRKKEVYLEEFKKPVYLMTRASWCVPSEGEIPALNQLAEKYSDQIAFVVLFWDTREKSRELAKNYHSSVKVLYVDELQNQSSYVVRMMKHSLGLPTTFLLNKDKKIIDIRRKVSHPYGIEFERSFNMNYSSFTDGISLLLINDTNGQQYTAQESSTP